MKKQISAAALALVVSTGAAFAADLPFRKEAPVYVPPPPPPMWTGFYAGLNAGYGFGGSGDVSTATTGFDQYYQQYTTNTMYSWVAQNSYTAGFGGLFAANSGSTNIDQSGFIGGGQAGYNYQWGQNFVVGLEADIQGSGIRGTGSYTGVGSDAYTMFGMPHGTRTAIGGGVVQANLDWFGTVRGRIGYLFTPNLLVYATGGLTYGGAEGNANHSSFSSLSGPMVFNQSSTGVMTPTSIYGVATGNGYGSSTLVGWNIGGGLEWMFMQNWSLKAEAFYYNLGSLNISGIAAAPPSNNPANMAMIIADAQILNPQTRVSYNGVIARMGLNYHFNWGSPAPVLAKY